MTKQVKVREDNYFAVQGWMVTELKLKGNALMLYAIIYGFSQTTNTAFTGSVDYLCEWLGGVSRPTVINTLDNLVKQGLLTKSSTTKGALIYNSYTALRPSKKILSDEDPTSKKTLPDTSKNFLLNKDSKDNIEKSISKEMEGKAPKKRSYSTILEDPVNKFVKEALSKFIQYCRGKNYTPMLDVNICICSHIHKILLSAIIKGRAFSSPPVAYSASSGKSRSMRICLTCSLITDGTSLIVFLPFTIRVA